MADNSSKAIRRSTKKLRQSLRKDVHKAVSVRVYNICSLIDTVLPRAEQLGSGSDEMVFLSRMANDYLPSTVNPYLAMPKTFAERNPLSDGRTPIQVLCAQLDVVYTELITVFESFLHAEGDKMLANGRFLDDKFGHRQNPLNLPPQPPLAPGEKPTPLTQQLFTVFANHLRNKRNSK